MNFFDNRIIESITKANLFSLSSEYFLKSNESYFCIIARVGTPLIPRMWGESSFILEQYFQEQKIINRSNQKHSVIYSGYQILAQPI